MKKKLMAAGLCLLSLAAFATPLKVWTVGETINYTDLNSNFSHVHSLMVGGHGPRLVNADVSASAAIAHTKLATPSLLPKVWGTVASCTSNPCTVSEGVGVTSVGWTSAGLMTVNFAARQTVAYAGVLTTRGAINTNCVTTGQTTTTFTVQCFTTSTGVAVNSGFTFVLLDVEN